MVWMEAMKEGMVPGTHGWDASIVRRYSRTAHPAFNLLAGGYSDFQLMSNLIMYTNSSPHRDPCDTDVARQILVREFSHLKEEEDAMDPQKKAEVRAELMTHMSTWDEWVHGKPGFRKKTFLGIPLPSCV
jgi:hypothetical protein